MSFEEAVRIAAANLWSHKLRSALTLLGVVIGVMSVIAVVSLVNGLNDYVGQAISSNLSADVFMVGRAASNIHSVAEWEASQKRRKFHYDDYEALRDDCHSCLAVAANLNKVGQTKYGTESLTDTAILGFTHEMREVMSRELASGRYFTRLDEARHAPVCDVGFDVVDKLLPDADPLGKSFMSTPPTAKSSAWPRSAARSWGNRRTTGSSCPSLPIRPCTRETIRYGCG